MLKKPGEKASKGEYLEVNSNGVKVRNGHTATLDKFETLPATSKEGNYWKKIG